MEAFISMLPLIFQLFMAGGVIYLIIDKLILSKREKADIESVKIDNANKIVEFYQQVDSLISSKTEPLELKIDNLENKMDRMTRWLCYNPTCKKRSKDPEIIEEAKAVANEE